MTGDEATTAVIDSMEAAEIPYMVAGSPSCNFYGVPGGMLDDSIVVHLGSVDPAQLAARLGPRFKLDPQRHLLQVRDSTFQIELFLLSDDPHDQQRFDRRLRVPLLGRQAWIPTVEDVIVMKLRWAGHGQRNKDIDDARNVIAVQGDRIDWNYVHGWCDQHGTREQLDAIRGSITDG